MQAVGGLFAMSADAVKFVFRRPFQWREFLEQSWFVARVALAPTLLVAIPFTVLVSFTLNILLRELGAADLSGAGAAFGAVTQVGPLVTVLIVAGAGATAMCADLGSRTIREEIDAMEVLGINPVQRLVTPRMLASGLVALLLNSLVVIIGIVGGYVFSVFVQDVNPGAFAAGITLLTGVPEVDHFVCQGSAVRSDRRIGRLLSRADDHRRWRQGRRQRRQRDGGLRVHVAVRRQRGCHRHRHPNVSQVAEGGCRTRCGTTASRLSATDATTREAGRDSQPNRRSHAVLWPGDRRDTLRGRSLPARSHSSDRRDQHGRGYVGDDRRNAGDRRLLDAGRRRHAGGAGIQLAGQYRHRGADRVFWRRSSTSGSRRRWSPGSVWRPPSAPG